MRKHHCKNAEKSKLRKQLFEKLLEAKDGIELLSLTQNTQVISNEWKQFRLICEKNIKSFNSFTLIRKVALLNYNQKQYLILNLRSFRYVIIDVEAKRSITSLELYDIFDEDFFVQNFDEEKEDDASLFQKMYHTEQYIGVVQEVLDFYMQNQRLLSIQTQLYYKVTIDNAWAWIYLDIVNTRCQVGFQTPDQFLYEQLFLNFDLTPFAVQDAQEKMGVKQMQEIFRRIKDIKIPAALIPKDWLTL